MNKTVLHPSHFIDAVTAAVIRQFAPAAEKLGQLHPEQLSEIYRHQWFHLFVPARYGGLERSLPEGIRIEEGLAWTDGSTAWVVTLCSGANWFSGFLSPRLAAKIFADPKVCLAGSGQPSGTAVKMNGGYKINGLWHYATGAPHATHFTANCIVETSNHSTGASTGIKAFLFLKEEVDIIQNWNTIGLQATASESFKVTDKMVGEDRCFLIDAANAQVDSPLYRYPFLQFAEATLAANHSGMAVRFFDVCKEIFREKKKPGSNDEMYQAAEELLALANQKLQVLRDAFYAALQQSWKACVNNCEQPEIYTEVSKTSRRLAITARQLADELYPFCGMTAADPSTEISRVWRNMHTASQHALLRMPAK